MNEIIKSIRVGTVDFFGIIIPGILLISMCLVGVFLPLLFLITDLSDVTITWSAISANTTLLLVAAAIFSYVLGYIIRLSSPDDLDKKSAEIIIKKEEKSNPGFANDGWPYNLKDEAEKYPYSKFRDYLKRRGHTELIRDFVTWCPDSDFKEGAIWEGESGREGKPILKTKRSKTAINKMKLDVRVYCPELSAFLESKEGHIRLMAGTWAAFTFSFWPVVLVFFILMLTGGIYWYYKIPDNYYFIFAFINFNLTWIMYVSNTRITRLFHYRRVSELFHIVQAAHITQQLRQERIDHQAG